MLLQAKNFLPPTVERGNVTNPGHTVRASCGGGRLSKIDFEASRPHPTRNFQQPHLRKTLVTTGCCVPPIRGELEPYVFAVGHDHYRSHFKRFDGDQCYRRQIGPMTQCDAGALSQTLHTLII